MRLFKRKNRLELSYYLKRKQREARVRAKAKYAKVVIILLIIPAIAITSTHFKARADYNGLLESISDNSTISLLRNRSEALRAKERTLSFYDKDLEKIGTMGKYIKHAGIEFGDNEEEAVKIIGLALGIANAESTMGTRFVYDYDYNCHNWWGIKPPSGRRPDGSYLRCLYNEEAGARTFASLIKRLYIDMDLDTPEKIANKWVGNNQTEHHKQWVENVNKFYNK